MPGYPGVDEGAVTRSFADRLLTALQDEELVPTAETYDRIRPKITDLGRSEYERIASIAGEDWETMIADFPSDHPKADMRRILGFGRALTAFLVAPVNVPEKRRETVLELGATANLLVAIFDEFVDEGTAPETILTTRRLRAAAADSRILATLATRVGPQSCRAMARLVRWYFTALRSLPHADDRTHVVDALQTDVREMYAAERRTLTDDQTPGANRVAAVTPFVVMGRPAWLAAPTVERERYREHVDWSRRMGQFVGLVDDAVDQVEDERAGVYNAVATRRASNTDEAVVRSVTTLGRQVLEDWERMTVDRSTPDTTALALSTCVGSWFGGVSADRPRGSVTTTDGPTD